MGANGVVLITTKQGVSERPTVSWTSNISISSPNKRIPMMSFDEYLEYQWWREDNGIGAGGVLETIYKDYTKPRDELEFVDGIVPMDWQDYVMGTSVSHNHRVSISGSSKTSNYLIAAGFSDSKGIIRQTGVKQTDMRFSYNRTLSKYIRIGTRASLAQVTTNMMQGGVANSGSNASMMRSMLSFRPFYNFQKEGSMLDDPDMADDAVSSGPPLWFKDFADRSAEIRILPSAYLEFTPLKWLTYKFSIGGDYLSRERSRWKGPLINNTGNRAIAGVNEGLNIRYNIDNMLMFNHEFNGGHRLSGTIGTTFMNALSRNLIVEGWNTVQYIPQFDNINSAPDTRYGYLDTQNAIISYLGRAVYSFRDRYVLTATYRVDGSSKFSKNNRYSSFPSFALAWRATEEKWLGSLKDVASVKFRFGWGRVGNEGLRPYQTKAEYAINSDTRYPDHSYGNLSEGITGSVPAVLANPDLIWETSEQSNVGADIGFFDNRLSLTVDLYKKLTRDLLQEMSLSSIAGFETMWMNRGEIENKGIEFSLDARIIDNEDFSWDFGVNGSFNRNKILYVGLPPQGGMAPYFSGEIVGSGNYLATPVNIFMEGQPMGVFYGYKTDGLVPVGQTGVKLSADGAPIPEGGINYVLSEKNDGGVLNPNLDRTILGNPNPDFVYGFNTSMRYKNLALSMNFNGVQGVDVVNVNRVMEENTGLNAFNIRRDAFYKQWTPENQNTVYPRVGVVQSGESSNFLTDRFVEDASYLRLANVTLSCDIPLKKKKFVQSINVNASVQNAFVITDYSGWDPEVNSFGSDLMRMGADMGSYPNARTYSFGISMNF
jgi:TonB-linked SusC/RagA family outer membrane protein